MNSSPQVIILNKQPFTWIALLLLSFANILFLCGWFHPLIASILSLGILLFIIVILVRNSSKIGDQQMTLDKVGVCKLIAVALGLFAFLFSSGFAGYFPTNYDQLVFRQALFINLVEAPWPLVLPNGKEMTYYLAGVLPPAFLARFVDEGMRQWVLLTYIYAVLLVAYVLASFYIKRISLSFFLMLCFVQDPVREVALRLIHYISIYCDVNMNLLGSWISQSCVLRNTSLSGSIGAFNSTIYVVLALSLILTLRSSRLLAIPCILALLIPITPLGALASLPVALYFYLPELKLKKLTSALLGVSFASILVACSAIYFLRSDNDSLVVGLAWLVQPWQEFTFPLTRQILSALLLVLPLVFVRKKDKIAHILWCQFLLSLVYIGSNGTTAHAMLNELWLKGIVVYGFLAFCLWAIEWHRMRKLRYAMCLVIIMGFALYVKNQAIHFSPQREVQDAWNGHLNHSDSFFDQSIPKTKASLIDGFILDRSGESEYHFPGKVFPAAPGADYAP